MEVHQIARGMKVRVIDENIKTPPSSILVKKGDIVTIGSLDGMYVNGINEDGDRIYIAAWTKVEILKT